MTIATELRAAVACTVAVLAVAPPAHAQSAEAEVLFREAKRLLKKGQVAEACDKLEASDRLEPTDGTELNLADCRERNGQLATAWAAFVKAAATAKHTGNADREAEARRRAAALEGRLVYLTITVPVDARVDGLVIKRNDAVVDPALWGQRVPVDPDDYEISAAAPGREPWRTHVEIKARHKKIEVPVLDPAPGRPDPAVAPGPAVERLPVRNPDTTSRWTSSRKWSLAFAITGVAVAGGSIALGLHAQSVEHDADAVCPMTDCADPNGISLNQSARRDALLANIGYATGGALAITAVVLWLTGGPGPHDAVSIVPTAGADRAGLSFVGGF